MSFQTTVNQQQTAVDMAAAARSLAPEVTTAFGLLMARFLQNGEVLPDLQLLQEILSRWLSDSGRQVLAIDDRAGFDADENAIEKLNRFGLLLRQNASKNVFCDFDTDRVLDLVAADASNSDCFWAKIKLPVLYAELKKSLAMGFGSACGLNFARLRQLRKVFVDQLYGMAKVFFHHHVV